ncbi:Sugar phosphatase YbiV [Arenibacter antarcticus]|uniref:HAD family hydrolase n=1 Tax=Arenibacter antarcticus TaxID=2040469 RepID=A0ABW5VCV1_9FLAO|nr:HAD family hydrolase [Arenibacter sp. H213]MCM4169525.1 Cof-type HAD-IIB family hydrolase [Arenibacter sp. H213]
MDLSKVRMVVTDMDGTLLNTNHEVSSKFFTLFQQLKEKDIIFVAASGRQYNSIVEKLDAIKDDIIVVAENGAYIRKQQKEMLATPLENGTIKEVLDILKDTSGIHTVLCGKENAYIDGESELFRTKLKEYYSEFSIIDDLSTFKGEILKIALYHSVNSEKHIYPLVKHLESKLKVKVSGENWLDLSNMNAHKGYALEQLQRKYGISKEETMVFGDYNNDLEMLTMGHFSFAMANAHPNVIETANFMTSSNDDFGVERVLEQLVLSKTKNASYTNTP